MTRTRPLSLLLLAGIGVVLGLVLNLLLVSRGLIAIVPPISLSVAFVALGAILIAMAWPVRRAAAGERRIDPFYATRVVILAQASALGGALLGGATLGILIYLVTRPVVPLGSSVATGGAALAAVIMVIAALVAEHLCSVPPDDDSEPDAAPAT